MHAVTTAYPPPGVWTPGADHVHLGVLMVPILVPAAAAVLQVVVLHERGGQGVDGLGDLGVQADLLHLCNKGVG